MTESVPRRPAAGQEPRQGTPLSLRHVPRRLDDEPAFHGDPYMEWNSEPEAPPVPRVARQPWPPHPSHRSSRALRTGRKS